MNHVLPAVSIFIITYVVMLFEKAHKTVAVLVGGCAMVLFHVVREEVALDAIDLNVLFLLTGMMVIVHFLAESGFFGYVAVKMAQVAKARPLPLILILCLATAGLSALVDNVTTVLLIAPVTFLITQQLEVSPIPYLVFEALASNVGGTATLIGDPPNILIGSAAELSFNQFLLNLGPVTFLCVLAVAALAGFVVRKHARVSMDIRARVMEMDARRAITDRSIMWKSMGVLGLVLAGFVMHEFTHVTPGTVALAGAALILLITKSDPEDAFRAVEWPTLFFFIGLFMLVSGLASTGVLDHLAAWVVSLTGHSLLLTAIMLLWFTGIFSAFIGAVPMVTTLIPMVKVIIPDLAESANLPIDQVGPALWWSLALGACLGGNGTFFGTAANVIVVQIARNNDENISFGRFMKYSIPVTLITLTVSTLYVFLRYT